MAAALPFPTSDAKLTSEAKLHALKPRDPDAQTEGLASFTNGAVAAFADETRRDQAKTVCVADEARRTQTAAIRVADEAKRTQAAGVRGGAAHQIKGILEAKGILEITGVFRGRELTRKERRLACEIAPIDNLIGGGIVRGRVSEIIGNPGAGKTSLAAAFAASITSRGEIAAWIDAGGGFDPASIAAAGVDLARMLWVAMPATRRSAEEFMWNGSLEVFGGDTMSHQEANALMEKRRA